MKKEIFISESMGESRIAIVEDDTLVEVYVEKQDKQRMVGNIYKGQVENVLPGMQAAFVDIGYDINAFLPFSEIENSAYLADVNHPKAVRIKTVRGKHVENIRIILMLI